MTATFDRIAAQRRAVADVLASLDDGQWATPSLCGGWSVREVAAHLVMPFEVGFAGLMWRMIRARGDFGKVSDDFARSHAKAPTTELVATLRANTGHRFTPPGHGPEAPLSDIVVHGLDLGVPVGAPPALPGDTANEVLTFMLTPKAAGNFTGKGRVDGLRFESTDSGWSAGSGPLVAGPAASLLLALTGRRVGLDALTGDGVPALASRL